MPSTPNRLQRQRPRRPAVDVYPPELVAAIARDAERDADRLVEFLRLRGLLPPGAGAPPVELPGALLLGLGLALRLYCWEGQGITVHLDAGIPSAREVLEAVVRWTLLDPVPDADQRVHRLDVQVIQVAATWLSWDSPDILGTDAVLGHIDDHDGFVDALAQLLWSQRKPLPGGDDGK